MFCQQLSDRSHEFDAFSRLLQEEPSAEQPAHAENDMNNHANAYNMYKRSTMELEQNGCVPPAEQPHAENDMDDHASAYNVHRCSSVVELEQNEYVPPTEQEPHAENDMDNHANAYNMYKKRSSELESPSLPTSAQTRASTSTIEKNAATKPASSSREGSSSTTVAQSLLHHRLHLLHRLHMLHRLVILHRLVQNEPVLFESQGRRIAAEVAEQAILGA